MKSAISSRLLQNLKKLDLSSNTMRKSFHNLAKEGYLVFFKEAVMAELFVIDIPEVETQAFKWLAVNPEFAKEYQMENLVVYTPTILNNTCRTKLTGATAGIIFYGIHLS